VLLSVVLNAHGVAVGQQGGGAAAPAAMNATYMPTMTFDVASVREAKEATSYMVSGWLDPHTSALRLENNTMQNLLTIAYEIDSYQIVGLPEWPYPAMFTIVAKSDHTIDEKLAKLSDDDARIEKQHMLQALLAERFKLKTHWETRQGAVYNLIVAKPGRLHEAKGGPPSAEDLKFWGDHPVPTLYQRNDGLGYDFIGHGASMSEIAVMLRGQLGRPVLDKTGLTRNYDFVLKYRDRTKQDRSADDLDPTLPMDEAIVAELGLKVVAAKGSIQVLVVDHVEKPSEN
jgi:uncharacterized protein (TIGR03435 family)